ISFHPNPPPQNLPNNLVPALTPNHPVFVCPSTTNPIYSADVHPGTGMISVIFARPQLFIVKIRHYFRTSFILCPQHATHRTALWACVFHPHFLHFSFRYMLSPPPSDRFASLLSSATPS